ncbi:FAD/NAD(P)-binding domain-containing protein [Aspergillus japonicus CBS 114.51]|uniref:FAD/NAD(P)-binding domain-containing protein n=2 Tax=Aspergillus TaxID=5052 RepID=A0A2V5GV59_ASPV1|nr:FAD/NAD(P)-binding domain-containing protein [Aspergillus japonicus CBS 114.51]PYI12992.1 FAD/NAD(P)-binding domain-containing protein [Aspergillus violaceofuscus CBS 115571]RAH76924.1 FAD/NAD(P)-binding domain-containing protein [Aspergillus japonicus CBS 114.51]
MPLKVVVVGAGLAGLGAAIALNRAGHDVEVLEQSSFLNEVGAAIHVAPNATRILRDWGCDFDSLQAVQCKRLQVWDSTANLIYTPVVTEVQQRTLGISDDWVLTHRVDLHNTLRATAAREVDGRKPNIRLCSRVVSVDAEAGVVSLECGETVTGDVIIGADGIHSRSVKGVTGEEPCKVSTGQNCFRFLVPVSKMLADPETAALVQKLGLDGVHAIASEDRRLVLYPCRGGDLLNVAGIYPAEPGSTVKDSSWLEGGSMETLLETYQSFSPALQAMCRQAEDLKLWSLASRVPPTTFVKGKLALVGDAAHPTLPHQGQGGAQSFEDGAALGAVFTSCTTPEQVPQRLELYNRVRYNRAITVQFMSKTHDEKRGEMLDELRQFVPDAEVPKNMFAFTWSSYPAREAERLLVEGAAA